MQKSLIGTNYYFLGKQQKGGPLEAAAFLLL
jgi:hypothetical protein